MGSYYAWVSGLAVWQVELQPCPIDVIEYIGERIAIREEGCGTIKVYPTVGEAVSNDTARPGDIYNQLARWEDVLAPHGWKQCGTKGELTLWVHPDSESGSHSGRRKTGAIAQSGVFYYSNDFGQRSPMSASMPRSN